MAVGTGTVSISAPISSEPPAMPNRPEIAAVPITAARTMASVAEVKAALRDYAAKELEGKLGAKLDLDGLLSSSLAGDKSASSISKALEDKAKALESRAKELGEKALGDVKAPVDVKAPADVKVPKDVKPPKGVKAPKLKP